MDILAALREIKSYTPEEREEVFNGGCICDAVDELDADYHELREAFRAWPLYSGSWRFPIPVYGRRVLLAHSYTFGWNVPLRENLLDHCIQYFKENE